MWGINKYEAQPNKEGARYIMRLDLTEGLERKKRADQGSNWQNEEKTDQSSALYKNECKGRYSKIGKQMKKWRKNTIED